MKNKWSILHGITIAGSSMLLTDVAFARELTFDDRVRAQAAIERVYWSHRIWPGENAGRKPVLEQVMPEAAIRAKVADYLAKSAALEAFRKRPLTPEELQAEMNRVARSTRAPHVLGELFAALDDEPSLIAECLARPLLVDRLIRTWAGAELETATANGAPFDAWWQRVKTSMMLDTTPREIASRYTRPSISDTSGCADDTWVAMPYGAPDTRNFHTAIWTGSEMIVWGGRGRQGNYLNTGGRYDPATDTWMPTYAGSGAPQGRAFHTAIWTGSKMVVWGGQLNATALNSGGRYDPLTDTWTATSTGTNAPSGRTYPAGVWTGVEMIVWGGWVSAFPGTYPTTGGRYDPINDTWTPTSVGLNLPGGRREFAAVWSGSEMIVWGGYDGAFLDTGGRYNPALDSWTSTSMSASRPTARSTHTAVWTGSEMIVWGGGGAAAVDTGARFNPAFNTWTPVSAGTNHPAARLRHTAVWTGSRMIVWGGASGALLNTGGAYDPSMDAWLPTGVGTGVPAARQDHTAVWTGDEMIVWGGTGGATLNSGGRFDPALDAWVPTCVGNNPGERTGHTAIWTGSEMIVWGGSSGTSLNTGGRYDAATDSWAPTSTAAGVPPPRDNHTAIWTGSEMIVWGGGFPGLRSGGRYNPATDMWSPTSMGAGTPSIRANHTAVWTGREMIVWGGDLDFSPLNSGARYGPSSNTWTATSMGTNVPAARFQHAAVWTGREMVVWSGRGQAYLNTGGRYDPMTDSWLPTSTGANVPSPRAMSRSAVWTGREMIVWGGFNGAYPNTGGRYDPALDSWSETSMSANLPTGRRDHTLVWTGSEMIVWGGFDGAGYLDTGGRYDPSLNAWLPTTNSGPAVPVSRQDHTAVWTGEEMIVWAGTPLTAHGGRYCAVPSCAVATWYRDGDGDGHGNSTDPVLACSQPFGYVAVGGDCNDANTSQAPGLPETCDGLDNDCDGTSDNVTPPSGSPVMTINAPTPSGALVSWDAVPNATGYDVVVGGLVALRASGGDFTMSTDACLADNTSATMTEDPDVPIDGNGFWYLVRAVNCGGSGTYDSGNASQNGNRDSEIAASANACP